MQLAIVAAGFSGGEADQLRRSMAAWKRRGGLEAFEERLIKGMRERGYSAEFAQQLFRQIKGFGEYGFPESHAASFALLVYVSAWLKCHEPAIFACALLNSQPMGFYAPAQIVQAAERQGVEVRCVDVNYSEPDCVLEPGDHGKPALRLGLRLIKGLSDQGARRLFEERAAGSYTSVTELAARVVLTRADYAALAAADALRSIAGNRYYANWQTAGIERPIPIFGIAHFSEGTPLLREPEPLASVIADYASIGLSLRQHPLALLRPELGRFCRVAAELAELPDKARVHIVGLVITRQRPGNAANVTFVTLEDETGFINLVIWEKVAEKQRNVLLNATVLGVSGYIQKQDGVLHVIAHRLYDRSGLLNNSISGSRDFH